MAKTPAAKKSRTSAKPRTPTLRVQVQHDIDQALAQAGIPSAIDSDGWRWMQDPSGKGLIGVVAVTGQREDLSLRVVAPITPLPKGQAALHRALRRIAEMNYEIPGHAGWPSTAARSGRWWRRMSATSARTMWPTASSTACGCRRPPPSG